MTNGIIGKIIITANLKLLSGLHISSGNDFAAIGAVDTTTVRDKLTKEPYIPGSSLKGKMRYLLACYKSSTSALVDIKYEDDEIKRLFGDSASGIKSRLQFSDTKFNKDSKEKIKNIETDLYLTEIKFENTISRISGVANPRQIERVVAGSEFDFKLVYNIENIDELEKDIDNIYMLFELLKDDYLGGHGTRGYGRVDFENLSYEYKNYSGDENFIKDIIDNVF